MSIRVIEHDTKHTQGEQAMNKIITFAVAISIVSIVFFNQFGGRAMDSVESRMDSQRSEIAFIMADN